MIAPKKPENVNHFQDLLFRSSELKIAGKLLPHHPKRPISWNTARMYLPEHKNMHSHNVFDEKKILIIAQN